MGRAVQLAGLLILVVAAGVYVARRVPAGAPPDAAAPPGRLLPPDDLGAPDPALAARGAEDPEVDGILALVQQRKGEEALTRVEAEIGEKGETAVRLALLGFARLAVEDPDEAKAAFDRALERDSSCTLARLGRARMSLGYRRYEEALERLQALCRDFPRHPEYLRLSAVAELGAGRPREALRTAVRAYRFNPRSRIAGLTVADCLLRAGRETEAAAWYRASLAAAESPEGPGNPGFGDSGIRERREAVLSVVGLIGAR